MEVALALLRVRLRSARNTLLKSGAPERKRARSGLVFTLVVILSAWALARGFFEPLAGLAPVMPAARGALERLPAFCLFSVFWMLMLSAVTVGIQVFYINQEFVLLLSAPISGRAAFVAKFVEAAFANATLFLTVGAPVMWAYGQASGLLSAGYAAQMALALLTFAVLPTALGLLACFVLMRVLPANRTRDLLAALGVAAFSVIYVLVSITARRAGDPAAYHHSLGGLAALASRPVFSAGPWGWAGAALNGAASGAAAWERIGWLCALSLAAVAVAAFLAERIHAHGWAAAQETPPAARATAVAAPSGAEGWERRLSWLPAPMRAVVLKDVRSLRRDMRQLSSFLIPLAVIGVLLAQYLDSPAGGRMSPLLFLPTLFIVLAPASFRLAMAAFIGENRAIWLMLAAPSDPLAIVAGKFLYTYMLSLPLACVVTALFGWLSGMAVGQTLGVVVVVLLVMAAFAGIGVGAAALFADFTTENPRFTVSSAARFVTFLVQLLFVGLLAAVAGGVYLLTRVFAVPAAPAMAGGAFGGLLVCAAFTALPLMLGARRFRRLQV